MFAHAIDATPSYQVAFADSVLATTGNVGTGGSIPAAAASPVAGDWRVDKVAGVDGLCFVRRGTGGWNGVVTVRNGQVMRLGEVQRPALQAAAFQPIATDARIAKSTWSASTRMAPAQSAVSTAWQRGAAYALLAIGLVLALKSGSMLLQGSRKYG